MCDGVEVYKENGCFTMYRYIDDWDEEGDTIYAVEEYLRGIPEQEIKRAIRAVSDSDVIKWIRAHLIKEQSNSIDTIIEFLEEQNVGFTYERN